MLYASSSFSIGPYQLLAGHRNGHVDTDCFAVARIMWGGNGLTTALVLTAFIVWPTEHTFVKYVGGSTMVDLRADNQVRIHFLCVVVFLVAGHRRYVLQQASWCILAPDQSLYFKMQKLVFHGPFLTHTCHYLAVGGHGWLPTKRTTLFSWPTDNNPFVLSFASCQVMLLGSGRFWRHDVLQIR